MQGLTSNKNITEQHKHAVDLFLNPDTQSTALQTSKKIRFPYDAKKYPKVSGFEMLGDNDYALFRLEFKADIEVIQECVRKLFRLGLFTSDYSNEFKKFISNLFETHTEHTNYSLLEDMPAMFGPFREMIRYVAELLQNDVITAPQKASALIEFLPGLTKCAAGLVTSLELCFTKLKSSASTPLEQFSSSKIIFLRDLTAQYIPKLYRSLKIRHVKEATPAFESHFGALLTNAVAEDYGIKNLKDRHHEHISVTEQELNDYKKFLACQNLPIEFFRSFVSDKITILTNIFLSFGFDLSKKSFVLLSDIPEGMNRRIDLELFEPLNTSFKDAPKLTFEQLGEWDDDFTGLDFKNAKGIISEWVIKHFLHVNPEIFAICGDTHIMTLAGIYFWCETKNGGEIEKRPIELSDINSLDLDSWLESIRLTLIKQILDQTTNKDTLMGYMTSPSLFNLCVKSPSVKIIIQELSKNKALEWPDSSRYFLSEIIKYFDKNGINPELFDIFPIPVVVDSLVHNYSLYGHSFRHIGTSLLLELSVSSLEKIYGTKTELEHFVNSNFQMALDEENIKEIKKLVLCGGLVNRTNITGKTSLMISITSGDMNFFELLIQNKSINLEKVDYLGKTALHYACLQGTLYQVKKLMALKPNLLNLAIENTDENCFHFAAQNYKNQDILCWLLAQKNTLDINKKDKEGRTTLMYVCRKESKLTIVKLLKNKNVNINIGDALGRTALYYAVGNNQVGNVNILLSRNDCVLNATTTQGVSILLKAISSGNYSILEMLLADPRLDVNIVNKVGEKEQTALEFALEKGDAEAINLLRSHHAIREPANDPAVEAEAPVESTAEVTDEK